MPIHEHVSELPLNNRAQLCRYNILCIAVVGCKLRVVGVGGIQIKSFRGPEVIE